MEAEKYSDDLKQIRSMMDRSTRFLSLSGMSGVLAGIYALIGAYFAYRILNHPDTSIITNQDYTSLINTYNANDSIQQLIGIAVIVLFMALVTAFILTRNKSKKTGQKLWGKQTFRLAVSFLIPVFIGGLFTLSLIQYGVLGMVAPGMLIFYGLGCMSASVYSIGTVKYLGLSCAILGLINTQFIGYGLYFWAAGFGLCHIIYGLIMYRKYDRSNS